jgi:hypothetical protein
MLAAVVVVVIVVVGVVMVPLVASDRTRVVGTRCCSLLTALVHDSGPLLDAAVVALPLDLGVGGEVENVLHGVAGEASY